MARRWLALGAAATLFGAGVTAASAAAHPVADWIATGKVKVFVQLGLTKARDIPADVPLALDFAKSTEDCQLRQLISAPSAAGYPSFMAAGVPAERVAAIRAAYVKTMNDPDYQTVAKKQGFEHDPISSEEIEAVVKGLYALPDSVKQRARQVLPGD